MEADRGNRWGGGIKLTLAEITLLSGIFIDIYELITCTFTSDHQIII